MDLWEEEYNTLYTFFYWLTMPQIQRGKKQSDVLMRYSCAAWSGVSISEIQEQAKIIAKLAYDWASLIPPQ